MTLNVRIPNKQITVGDVILKRLGKTRHPIIPEEAIRKAYDQLGPTAYLVVEAKWESFWMSLVRPIKDYRSTKPVE
ncbi:MAG: hypothetical protein WCF96_09510 [Eubacteriales bacterium]